MQGKARYVGFEAEASAKLLQLGGYAINLDGLADYVHAQIASVGPAPGIPPLRLLAGLEAQGERLQSRIALEHVIDQKRIALHETPTEERTRDVLGKRVYVGVQRGGRRKCKRSKTNGTV